MTAAVCIAGPTATGKTGLALSLAERWPVEIISVDSAQVYRYMDIGTAKPDADVRRRLPHHLIDIRDPRERYSAGEFRIDALAAIRRIAAAGRLPLLVGGTLLYFRALRHGLAALPPADAALRAEIDAEAEREGWAGMHRVLKQVDPVAAARIAPTDRQRIQRALEVYRLTGEPISHLQSRSSPAPDLRFACFALLPPDRAWLNARIESRLQSMLAAGFVDEVRRLQAMPGMHADLPSMRAVGYRQLWRHLAGDCSLDEAVERSLVATRRYAKRQMTWLRSEIDFELLDCVRPETAGRLHAAVESALAAGA